MNTRLTLLSALLVVAFAGASSIPSMAYTPDVDTMNVMGFSPDTIDMAMTARSRAEWRGVRSRKRSPGVQILYNLIHNDPTGGLDESGHNIIRRD